MAADLGSPPAVSGIVPTDSSFPPTVTGVVVPTDSCFPPPTSESFYDSPPIFFLTESPVLKPPPGRNS